MKGVGMLSVGIAGNPDVVDDASSLKKISDESCEIIIASHVLEHLNYSGCGKDRIKKTVNILKIWQNKLISGGMCYIGVPDLDLIIKVLTKYSKNYWMLDDTPYKDIIGPIFGGMHDEHNCHSMLYNYSCLRYCMEIAGFIDIYKVKDASKMLPEYNPSANDCRSLNVCGIKK